MTIEPRLNLVTLGVTDVDASERFYRSLGWEVASAVGTFRLFNLAGAYLALFPVDELAKDADVAAPGAASGFRGVTCAINLESEAAVDAAFEVVRQAGGQVVKSPAKAEWGGYSGYFADPDGHLWEIAYNPFWPIGPDGRPIVGQ